MKVLVCGGAGYIGSHLVREILKLNYHVVVLDNLSKGHREAVPSNVDFELGDIRNKQHLINVFKKHLPDAVFHFCASIEVGESVKDPLKYYENNVCGTVTLLQVMQEFNTKYFIFSSTAALFGLPTKIPIEADDLCKPINPYGDTKLAVENILKWYKLLTFGVIKPLALDYLVKNNVSGQFNLGSGQGFSVLEIIEAARRVTGHPIPAQIKERRPGDPDILVADSTKTEQILGWKRQYSSIDEIVRTAWNFHQKNPHGLSKQ